MIMAARTGWSLSDNSDESSDSSGAASFELSERIQHLGLANGQRVEFTPQQSWQGLNALDHSNDRFHTLHRSAVDVKNHFIAPLLRPSPSMPQLKALPFQNGGSYDTLGTSSSTSYPNHTIINQQHTAELSQRNLQLVTMFTGLWLEVDDRCLQK